MRGTVTIGTVTSHNVDIPDLLADFHGEHPECRNHADHGQFRCADRRRAHRALDAAIVSVGSDECRRAWQVEVVTDEAIDAAVCRDRPVG